MVHTAAHGHTLDTLHVMVRLATEIRAVLPLVLVVEAFHLVVVVADIMEDTMVEVFPLDRLVVVTHRDRLVLLVVVHLDRQVLDRQVPLGVAAAAAVAAVVHTTHRSLTHHMIPSCLT